MSKIEFVVHGPGIVSVSGGGYSGVFADAYRASKWLAQRMSGEPYSPIPKAGEF